MTHSLRVHQPDRLMKKSPIIWSRKRITRSCLAMILAFCSGNAVQARDLIEVQVTDSSITPNRASASGSDLQKILESVIEARDNFRNFRGIDYMANLRYGTVENAMLFE